MIDKVTETVEVIKLYKEIGVDAIDKVVKDTVKVIKEIVDFYEKSSKYEVAYQFSMMLMKKSIGLYEDYRDYFSDRDINQWTINSIISKRVDFYIKK